MRENEYIAMFSGIHGAAPFAADAERWTAAAYADVRKLQVAENPAD